jgi:MraZ protein
MLLGEFQHSLDAKGRIFLPAKWRDELAGEVVVTRGMERHLRVMTKKRFGEQAAQLAEHSTNMKATRDYSRLFFSAASEEPVDKSGRMSIPANLREYAGLERDVVVMGVSNEVEIWDRQAWATYKSGVEGDYQSIAEQLGTASKGR